MSSRATSLSLADYAALSEPDPTRVSQLVRGMVVREPRPGNRHGRVQVTLAVALGTWAREHGAACTVESGYVLSDEPATVRGPDVAVVLEPRSAAGVPGGWVRGAPDLAVEIVSPGDSWTATHAKILDYLDAGARLVWIVDPEARTVWVHRPDGTATLVRHEEMLSGEDVLEGLAMRCGEVFE